MKEYTVQWVEIEKITPYEKNAKKHDKTQIANVAESIKQFGWTQPIVCDKDGVIIIGHCRLLAAKKLKLDKVPVKYAMDLTEEQVKKLRNLDNKLNESEWDFDLLATDIDGLDFSGFDIDWGLPADVEEIERKQTKIDDNKFQIIIDCENEIEQEEVYNKIQGLGIECRVSTL